MPMTKEEHEQMLQDLLNPELEQSKRTDILQQLRVDYGSVLADFSELTETRDKLKADNEDLVIANSKLFRERGITTTEEKEKEDEKSRSETITIKDLEGTSE